MKSVIQKLDRPQTFKDFRNFKTYLIHRFNADIPAQRSAEVSSLEKTGLDYYQLSSLLHEAIDRSVLTGDLSTGKVILTHLVKLVGRCGFTSVWNKVVGLWCKCGEVEFAEDVFDKMPDRDAVSYNTLFSAYVRRKCDVFEMVRFYLRMVDEGVKPNCVTFSRLISACGDEGGGSLMMVEVFHGLVVKLGLSCNVYVGSSIVNGYANWRILDDAVRAFDEMVEADLVSWNILIDGFARSNDTIRAFQKYSQMLSRNVMFDEYTLTSVVKTCTRQKDLHCGMQIHCCVVKFGFGNATATCNSLMTMYAKCEKGMRATLKVFEDTHFRNVISWTAIITGLMQDGHNTEAINFYKRMLMSGVDENQFTFASIIPAIGNSANLEQARQVHAKAAKSNYRTDVSMNNALIDMYSKCGNLDDARLVFGKMGEHDMVSYTTMINALGQHGMGTEALQILRLMTVKKVQPDHVTFLSCLSACSHSGLLDEGIVLFRSMINLYNIKPRMEHFSCVVDMLGRAGKLNDAQTFIHDMGLESDLFVWEALLSACRLHGDMTLGQKSAKMIMELQPLKHEPYVMLSDIYAVNKLWNDKRLAREILAIKGLKKERGVSCIS